MTYERLVAIRRGQVRSFSFDEGFGEVEDDHGERYFFHCSVITDGTRDIAVGAPCAFFVLPGHGGRLEAREVTKL